MKLLTISQLKTILLIVMSVGLFALTLRGLPGNPNSRELNSIEWTENGPFELSPERGRFALVYSLVEDKSFQFSLDLATFSAPDVATSRGSFVSLFAPGVSLFVIPGYVAGKALGYSQVGTFAVISCFAIANILFIRTIARRLGTSDAAATLGAFCFAFASPAFAYAVSLYQHHVSTFLILSSVYVLMRWKSVWSLGYIWVMCGLAVMIDNPNFFFMFPVGLFALTRLISVQRIKDAIVCNIRPLGVLTLPLVFIPLAIFMYVNYQSYGDPFQLAGTASDGNLLIEELRAASGDISTQRNENLLEVENSLEIEEEEYKRSALGFFKTRQLPNGMFTHILSSDRGTIMYTPIMFIGILGLFFIGKEYRSTFQLLLSIALVILLVYSMWGDPYGGWAFGSRYMIPAYAILSIGLAVFVHTFRTSLLVFLLVVGLSAYSTFVNVVGATTTSRIPPKVQVLSLEEQTGVPQPYTYKRGMEQLDRNFSKSFFFRTVASNYGVEAWQYVIGLTAVINVLLFVLAIRTSPIPGYLENIKGRIKVRGQRTPLRKKKGQK